MAKNKAKSCRLGGVCRKSWKTALVLIFVIAVVSAILFGRPKSVVNFPDSLSLTIVKMPELEEQATLSFAASADGARIVYPFHWDLKEDVRLGNKTVFSVKLYPEQVSMIRGSDKVIAEGYHSIGNWSRHEFYAIPITQWEIGKIDVRGNQLLINLRLNDTVQASDMLIWTTIRRTSYEVPGASADAWISRSKGKSRRILESEDRWLNRGGYWPMKLSKPLSGDIIMGMEIPPDAIIHIPQETLVNILEGKTEAFNMILGDEGSERPGFYITEIEGNLTMMAGELLLEK